MSDRNRLNAVLQKLGDRGALPVPAGSAQEILIGLLRAIDETVLARNLIVSFGESEFTLHVSRRALLKVSGSVTAELAEADQNTLIQLGEELAAKLEGQTVDLKAVRPTVAPGSLEVGALVPSLAAAWSSIGGARLEISDLLDSANTFAVWDGDDLSENSGLADALIAQIDRAGIRTAAGGSRGLVFVGDLSTETVSAFAWDGEIDVLAIFLSELVPTVLSGWNK